jgi:ribosome biogenesis GTPase
LAPGDVVDFVPDVHTSTRGTILLRLPRRNSYQRWNRKRRVLQTTAANVDVVVCIASAGSPPFRPRFIDRVLVNAEHAGIRGMVVLNKVDQPVPTEARERLEQYVRLGYSVWYTSAETGEGLQRLRRLVRRRRCLLFGQSGVGKSSVLNGILPQADQKVGDVSWKYNRGRHTTNYACLFPTGALTGVVDTPGIREMELPSIGSAGLDELFPEMTRYIGDCRYATCTHAGEDGCAVAAGVECGAIHRDRYESYQRMLYEQLAKEERSWTTTP